MEEAFSVGFFVGRNFQIRPVPVSCIANFFLVSMLPNCLEFFVHVKCWMDFRVKTGLNLFHVQFGK